MISDMLYRISYFNKISYLIYQISYISNKISDIINKISILPKIDILYLIRYLI